MDHLSDDQLQQVKAVFARYDPDGNGFVTVECLGVMLRMLGLNPTNDQITTISNQAAALGRLNQVDFPDFLDLVAHNFCLGDNLDRQLKAAFRVFDRSGTGRMPINELRYALTTLGEILSSDEVDAVLSDAGVTEQTTEIEYEPLVMKIAAARASPNPIS